MTRSEWIEVVKRLRANWPHIEVPDNSIAKWYDDLKEREVAEVLAGVESFYRDGREFPPNGGQILARLAELERGDPDHGEAWSLAMQAVKRFGFYQSEHGVDWLHDRSPAVATAVMRFGYIDLCHFDLDNIETVRAQFREVYKAVCSQRQRDKAYVGLPLPEPRGELRKIRPLEAIEGGDAA